MAEPKFFRCKSLSDANQQHQLAYYDVGDPLSEKVAVCVHGLTRNAHDFDLLAHDMAEAGWRVLSLSMAGRGNSDWLANPMDYHYGQYVADCIAFLDNFHLRHVTWVGTSMGGIIGMMLAAELGKRIERLVLNDIGTFVSADALQRIMAYVQDGLKPYESVDAAAAKLRENMQSFGITDEAHWQHLIRHSILEKDGRWWLACDPAILVPLSDESRQLKPIDAVDLSAVWEKVACPTLILRGSESDILSSETVSAMCASHVGAQAITFEGCGHAPALMAQDQRQAITKWLGGRPANYLAI